MMAAGGQGSFTFSWKVNDSFLDYHHHPLTLNTNLSRTYLRFINQGQGRSVRIFCAHCNNWYNGRIYHSANKNTDFYQLTFRMGNGSNCCMKGSHLHLLGQLINVEVNPQNLQVTLTPSSGLVQQTSSSPPPPPLAGGASTAPLSIVSSPCGGGCP